MIGPDDPRHGEVAGYNQGCDCRPCKDAKAAYARKRKRRIGYGMWAPFVDAEPVRAHLAVLAQHGIGWRRAADLAGVPTYTVAHIMFRRGAKNPAHKCRPATAAKLLAVRPSLDDVAANVRIPAVGTVRRIQALSCLGWSHRDQAARTGLTNTHIGRLDRGKHPTVTAAAARAVRAMYDDLSMRPAPSGHGSARCRLRAQRLGYAPPLAWDDIDDPEARPAGGRFEPRPAAKVYIDARSDGMSVEVARRAAGLSETTAARYEHRHKLRGTAA